MSKVHEALMNIQQSLFVPKGNRNNFGGYNYRSCEDILKVLKPLLLENKCSLDMDEEMVAIGNRIYCKAIITLTSVGDGDSVKTSAFAMEPESRKGMDAAQVSGSSLSYARKYALAGLFGIDNEKDPDATNDHKEMMTPPRQSPSTQGKALSVWNAWKAKYGDGVPKEELKNAFGQFVKSNIGKDAGPSLTDDDWRSVEKFI